MAEKATPPYMFSLIMRSHWEASTKPPMATPEKGQSAASSFQAATAPVIVYWLILRKLLELGNFAQIYWHFWHYNMFWVTLRV